MMWTDLLYPPLFTARFFHCLKFPLGSPQPHLVSFTDSSSIVYQLLVIMTTYFNIFKQFV